MIPEINPGIYDSAMNMKRREVHIKESGAEITLMISLMGKVNGQRI
jgi:hypothetical protein